MKKAQSTDKAPDTEAAGSTESSGPNKTADNVPGDGEPDPPAPAAAPAGTNARARSKKSKGSVPQSKPRSAAKAKSQETGSAAVQPEAKAVAEAPAGDGPEPPSPPASAMRPAASAPPGAGTRVVAWLALVVSAVILVGAVTWPLWSERLSAALPFLKDLKRDDAVVLVLQGRVDKLESQAQALERARGDVVGQLEAEREEFAGTIEQLMGRVGELEKELKEAQELAAIAQSTDDIQAASQSLSALTKRLEKLEQAPRREPDLSPHLSPLVDRLERVEQSGAQALDQALKQSKGREKQVFDALRAVTERLDLLEKAAPGGPSDAAGRATVLAVAQLRVTVRSGRPFTDDLEALRAVAGDAAPVAEPLEVLAGLANTGVPSLAKLRADFAAIAGAVAAEDGKSGGGDWVEQTTQRIRELVRIRRVGESVEPESPEGRVSRAEALLAAGDLKAAVDVLANVSGGGADLLKPWMAAAGQRLAAEKALAMLHIHAVSLVGPAKVDG